MPISNHNRQLQQIRSAEQYYELRQHSNLPAFDARLLISHRPDCHWAFMEDGFLKARCSLWWREAPSILNGKAGLIGHYAAADADSAAALLGQCCQQLVKQGCNFAIGPMDQNTWRDYRFIIDDGVRPRFFLEPNSQAMWPEQFRRDGFKEIAWYTSSLVNDLNVRSRRLARVKTRMGKSGITIRNLNMDQLDSELKSIFAVVKRAFQENPFYVPVSEADFLEMYRPLEEMITTDLILLAEHHGRVIGFIFAVPDVSQASNGLKIDTVVVKTFGVFPDRIYGGVGQVLLEEVHHRAAAANYRYAIHALVRESAPMKKIIARYGVPFRRYALFGKELT
ncbi:hypothetical protein N9D23_11390 [Rubripirellula sp.]|nr:hypothetical protein [Rubripirellula sp.]